MDEEEKYFLLHNIELGDSENAPDNFGTSNGSDSQKDPFTPNE